MKALVTGFEPFGGDGINPSLEAVRRLPAALGELTIATRILPCAFARAIPALEDAMAVTAPDIVLCVGLAGSRSELSLERVGINVDDARIPDNEGDQPIDRAIVPGAPAAYFATLPIKAAVLAIREAGLPAAVSNTAGTFVCNHVLYGLMHLAPTRFPALRGGFLHVPYLPSQAARLPAGTPSLGLDQIVRGIEIILTVAASRQSDVAAAEGAIS